MKEFFPSLPERRNGYLKGARVGVEGTGEPRVESRRTERGYLCGWSQRV